MPHTAAADVTRTGWLSMQKKTSQQTLNAILNTMKELPLCMDGSSDRKEQYVEISCSSSLYSEAQADPSVNCDKWSAVELAILILFNGNRSRQHDYSYKEWSFYFSPF